MRVAAACEIDKLIKLTRKIAAGPKLSDLRELVREEALEGYAELHLSTYLKTILKLDLFYFPAEPRAAR